MKNTSNFIQSIFIELKILQASSKLTRQFLLIVLLFALSSFFLWYRVFEEKIPVEIKMSAPSVEIVRAYWNDSQIDSNAYKPITIKPIKSQQWQLKIEALGEKNQDSDGFEVVLLDVRTSVGQIDWSQGEFSGGKWEFRPDPSGPQGKVAIAHSNNPEYGTNPGQIQSFSTTIEGGDLQLFLLSHTGSGKVRITANQQVRNLDLHSYGQKHETINFYAGEAGDRKVRDYQIEIPDRSWQKIQFQPEGKGNLIIQEVRARNKILTINSQGEYILPFQLFKKQLILTILFTIATISIFLSLILSFSIRNFAIVLGFTLLQGVWTVLFESINVGILNTLPTFVLLSIWLFFIKTAYPQKYFWKLFTLLFLLTLRIPITVGRSLEFLNWIIYFIIIALVFKKIFDYFKLQKKSVILLSTVIIVWFNAFNHISHDSPYTYVNRATNFYWECPHETYLFMVNCDHGHYLAEEFIFVQRNYEASFSVKLRRFFYGYLSSLIGYSGHRWVASYTLNLFFWLLSCVALYKICILTNLGERVATIAMLCCASSWGFISFVGQPTFYMAAYAYAAIAMWATLEILAVKSRQKMTLFLLIIISGTLVYDIYPIVLSTILILLFNCRIIPALAILIGQVFLSFVWKNVYLARVLGTIGDQSNFNFAVENIQVWLDIIGSFDTDRAIHWIGRGTQSFIYGNMIFGAIASLIFIIFLLIKVLQRKSKKSKNILLLFSFIMFSLVWLSTIAMIPKSSEWGIGGMLPRYAFYSYPVGTIALAFLGSRFIGKSAYIIPVLTFIVGNIDSFTGLASIAVFFDYGSIGLYWK